MGRDLDASVNEKKLELYFKPLWTEVLAFIIGMNHILRVNKKIYEENNLPFL